MIAQATGWQHLRALSLNVVPYGTKVYHSRALPLNQWRCSGAFFVSSCSKKRIVLEASGPRSECQFSLT